jgi:hypothetical protein
MRSQQFLTITQKPRLLCRPQATMLQSPSKPPQASYNPGANPRRPEDARVNQAQELVSIRLGLHGSGTIASKPGSENLESEELWQ